MYPETDIAVCQNGEPEPAGRDRSQRLWCYWYAAYWKNDTGLCQKLWSGDMYDLCKAGRNPEDYYILELPSAP
jgi:hypothetical protein